MDRIILGSPGFAMIRQSYILLCLGFSRRSTSILYFFCTFPTIDPEEPYFTESLGGNLQQGAAVP